GIWATRILHNRSHRCRAVDCDAPTAQARLMETCRVITPSSYKLQQSKVSIKSYYPLPKERKSTGTGSTTRLPQDLIEKTVNRLGVLGLISAAVHPLFHYAVRLVVPADVLRTAPVHAANFIAMCIAVTSGLAIYTLTRIGRVSPAFKLDAGLIFEVLGAFCIGLIEAHRAFAQHPLDTGPGGIAFW